ncbi:MAG: adenosylcobinamide-GDP ribazoletransferase [Anaerolineaceae bacterium]|nr:adenosylcobinamide-GDP ribazoletransferase [Anaerolineaceae bacterium]
MIRPDLFNSLRMALGFLTILPVPQKKEWSDPDFGWSAVFYPLTGALIGALAGWGYMLFSHLPAKPVAALLTLILWILLSGGLHLDGFADCMDGFCCSASPERRLEILKDSRLGTYGALGLFCALIMKWQCILYFPGNDPVLFFALTGASARWAMLLLIPLPLANPNGLAAMLKKHCPRFVPVYALPVPLLLAFLYGYRQGLLCLILASMLAGSVGLLAKKKIGGINGDVLGFSIELAEIVLLTAVQVIL